MISILLMATTEGALAQGRNTIVQNPQPQGRYAIYFSPFENGGVYLLDTETGKIWKNVIYAGFHGAPDVWMTQDRVDNQRQILEWETKHSDKKP